MRLTDTGIRGLQAKKERYEVADDVAPGLRVRVGATGKKVFIFRYSFRNKVATETLGTFPDLTLVGARRKVEDARERMLRGEAPFVDETAPAPLIKTFSIVAEEYLAQPQIKTLRTYGERCTEIRNHIIPELGALPIDAVGKEQVRAFVGSVLDRGSPTIANRLQWLCKAVMKHAEEEGYIQANPIWSLKRPHKNRPRERVLSVTELRALWAYLTHPKEQRKATARCIAFMLATGQRRKECAFIAAPEVDKAQQLWILPGERAKNGRAHAVPLTDWHLELLGDAHPETKMFFHSERGSKRYEGKMDPASVNRYVEQYIKDTGCDHFTPHDLRRTFTTLLGKLEVAREHRKRLLNHTDGDVTSVYDLYDYIKEKRQAMETWRKFMHDEVIRR